MTVLVYSRSHYQLRETSEKRKSFPPNIGKWERKCRWRRKTCLEKSAWVRTTIEWNEGDDFDSIPSIHALIFRLLLSFGRGESEATGGRLEFALQFPYYFGITVTVVSAGGYSILYRLLLVDRLNRKINFNLALWYTKLFKFEDKFALQIGREVCVNILI